MQHLAEPPVLSSEMIVDWKRKRGLYNFVSLPRKAIVGLASSVFKPVLPMFPRKLKGIPGRHFIQGSYVYCSEFGSGAPALITLMEELRALGVQEFIFIGLSASLLSGIASGSSFFVSQAWSANGITASYAAGTLMKPGNETFVNTLAHTMGLEGITCVSTDSPFRETAEFIRDARAKGCSLVEMECAAVYAFGRFHNLDVACLLVVADQLEPCWQAPPDMPLLASVQQHLVRTIVKHNL